MGILNVRDLLAATPQLDTITLRMLTKPAILIPMTWRANEIIEDMRAEGAWPTRTP